jgi:hypothetical protein
MSRVAFKHYLVTRFNVNVPFAGKGLNVSTNWLERRFDLFGTFCYPSVANQSLSQFEWLAMVHPATPKKFIQKLTDYDNLSPVLVEDAQEATVSRVVRERADGRSDFLITSRLDNDDAINRNFIQTVQDQFKGQAFQFITLTDGCEFQRGSTRRLTDKHNAFVSLIEESSSPRTVYCCKHNATSANGPVTCIRTAEPMWMIVIHDCNVSNRFVEGKAIPVDLVNEFGIASNLTP